eukprot:jgi/Ulvmu1/12537/UM090_0024.1
MSDNGGSDEGVRVVRASKRADGTFRKERKIRDGYIPPDEQVAYVSRGKQYQIDRDKDPVPGFDTADQVAAKPMSKSAKKNAARKAKKGSDPGQPAEQPPSGQVQAATKAQNGAAHAPSDQQSQHGAQCQESAAEAGDKRARALKKKIRQITTLQDKSSAGEQLTPEQQVKLDSLSDLQAELDALELK